MHASLPGECRLLCQLECLLLLIHVMRHLSTPFPICSVLQVCVHHGDINSIGTGLHAEVGKFQVESA